MTDSEKAVAIIEALKAAEHEPAAVALPILNGLVGLVQAHAEAPLEVDQRAWKIGHPASTRGHHVRDMFYHEPTPRSNILWPPDAEG